MTFYSIDKQTSTISIIQEPQTLAAVSYVAAVAIARWLSSGLDCPDANATDGISEVEANL